MRKKIFLGLISVVLLQVLIIFFGCNTTETIIKGIMPAADDLKKRVMVLPFIDQAGLGPDRATKITEDFRGLLEESPRLLLYDPPNGESFPLDMKSLELGVVTHPKLVRDAEELGMNVIITGIIYPTEIFIEDTGIWPFSESSKIYEITVVVNVADIRSGALLSTQSESAQVCVPVDEATGQKEKDLINQLWIDAQGSILERQASTVTENLWNAPWSGKILAVENGTIKISAGKEVGLIRGHRLEVFARGESIPSISGRSFEIPGKKIGEIEADAITDKDALAVPVEGGPFSAGQVIKLKR